MEALFITLSAIGFILFLIPTKWRGYCGTAGWGFIVLYLISEIPRYLSENNILYPSMAVLSIPFLFITGKYLLQNDSRAFSLSKAAAVAFLIYAPFAYITLVGNWLIGVVTGEVLLLLNLFGQNAMLVAWNIIIRNGFRTEIILACTGIQSIAIMLGVVVAVPTTTRQKFISFILIVPTIYILNLFRNVGVIIAYTGQWFPYLPEIAGNGEYGYESFFWAHNIIAEFLALIFLIWIVYNLFRIIPALGELASGLVEMYWGEIRKVSGKDK